MDINFVIYVEENGATHIFATILIDSQFIMILILNVCAVDATVVVVKIANAVRNAVIITLRVARNVAVKIFVSLVVKDLESVVKRFAADVNAAKMIVSVVNQTVVVALERLCF